MTDTINCGIVSLPFNLIISPMKEVKVGTHSVGEKKPVFIIAEIGINHNGKMDIAKLLFDLSVAAGCDAVKFPRSKVIDSKPGLGKTFNSFLSFKTPIEFTRVEKSNFSKAIF